MKKRDLNDIIDDEEFLKFIAELDLIGGGYTFLQLQDLLFKAWEAGKDSVVSDDGYTYQLVNGAGEKVGKVYVKPQERTK